MKKNYQMLMFILLFTQGAFWSMGQVTNYEKIILGTYVNKPDEILAFDYDLDGDMDVVSTSVEDESLHLLTNTGNGHYKYEKIIDNIGNVENILPTDYNNDGDLDILISQGNNLLVIQNNTSHWQDIVINQSLKSNPIVVDIDFDGSDDYFYFTDSNLVWVSDLNTTTILETVGNGDDMFYIDVADYENDGDLDIFYAGKTFQSHLVNIKLNDGSQLFSNAFTKPLRNDLSISDIELLEFRATHLDGNDSIDFACVWLAFTPYYIPPPLDLYINEYTGKLTAVLRDSSENITISTLEVTSFIDNMPDFNLYDFKVADVNSDGMDDIFFARNNSNNVPITRLRRFFYNGSTFSIQHLYHSQSLTYHFRNFGSIYIEDMNQDGVLDVLYSLRGTEESKVNLISYFTISSSSSSTNSPISDFRKTYYLEKLKDNVLTANIGSTTLLNTCYDISIDEFGGVKLLANQLSSLQTNGTIAELNETVYKRIDLDGDGDLDLRIGDVWTGHIKTLENINDTSYVDGALTINDYSSVIHTYFEDYDLDGDLDIFLDGGIKRRLNNNGTYGPLEDVFSFPSEILGDFAVLIEDIDSDGDDDVVLALHELSLSTPNKTTAFQVYQNTGSNVLTPIGGEIDITYFRFTKDVDGDGDTDLVCDKAWLENLGNFNFIPHYFPTDVIKSNEMVDIDNDGDLDLLALKASSIVWYLNDGDGNFMDEIFIGDFTYESKFGTHVSSIDYNNNGYLDVIAESSAAALFKNKDYCFTSIDLSISNLGYQIVSNQTGASYQWLNCNDSNSIIPNATSNIFTSESDGDFAVEITYNGCVDTSECVSINSSFDIPEVSSLNSVKVFPNPTTGIINLDFGLLKEKNIRVLNQLGQVVYQKNNISDSIYNFNLDAYEGIYIVEVYSDNVRMQFKIIKQ